MKKGLKRNRFHYKVQIIGTSSDTLNSHSDDIAKTFLRNKEENIFFRFFFFFYFNKNGTEVGEKTLTLIPEIADSFFYYCYRSFNRRSRRGCGLGA